MSNLRIEDQVLTHDLERKGELPVCRRLLRQVRTAKPISPKSPTASVMIATGVRGGGMDSGIVGFWRMEVATAWRS